MGIESQRYHGWWVSAAPFNGYWVPECHRGIGELVFAGRAHYESPREAINAAQDFVNHAIPRAALASALDDWRETGEINDQEYEKLMQSIYKNV